MWEEGDRKRLVFHHAMQYRSAQRSTLHPMAQADTQSPAYHNIEMYRLVYHQQTCIPVHSMGVGTHLMPCYTGCMEDVTQGRASQITKLE